MPETVSENSESNVQLSIASTFVGTAGMSSGHETVISEGTFAIVGNSLSRISILCTHVNVWFVVVLTSPQQAITLNSSISQIFWSSSALSSLGLYPKSSNLNVVAPEYSKSGSFEKSKHSCVQFDVVLLLTLLKISEPFLSTLIPYCLGGQLAPKFSF